MLSVVFKTLNAGQNPLALDEVSQSAQYVGAGWGGGGGGGPAAWRGQVRRHLSAIETADTVNPLGSGRTLGGGGESIFESFGKVFDCSSSIETQNSIDADRHTDA